MGLCAVQFSGSHSHAETLAVTLRPYGVASRIFEARSEAAVSYFADYVTFRFGCSQHGGQPWHGGGFDRIFVAGLMLPLSLIQTLRSERGARWNRQFPDRSVHVDVSAGFALPPNCVALCAAFNFNFSYNFLEVILADPNSSALRTLGHLQRALQSAALLRWSHRSSVFGAAFTFTTLRIGVGLGGGIPRCSHFQFCRLAFCAFNFCLKNFCD